jgi:ADP-heptose:LPS heptosyltransferase
MKILILRFSSIGDIVLTTPVIRVLKKQLSDVEIHFATKSEYGFLLEENPHISKVYHLEDSLGTLISDLRKEKYDFIVDLHNNVRTRYLKLRLGVKSQSLNKLNIEKWLFTNFKINRLPNKHIVERYAEVVKSLGVELDEEGLEYYIPHKDEVENSWLPATHQNGYAAVVIGGKYATKRLPTKRIIELCDRINKPVILLGGTNELATGKEIEKFFAKDGNTSFDQGLRDLGKETTIFNACGKFNLNQSASILRNANWVFSHDTGLMHVAAAFGKHIYSIWGNTTPLFGMYPYNTKFTVFENNKLKCRPCSKIGFNKCPKGHFKCMNDVVFDFWLPD